MWRELGDANIASGAVVTFRLWAVAFLLAEIVSAMLFAKYVGWGWLPL